jgi:hypothetical protein
LDSNLEDKDSEPQFMDYKLQMKLDYMASTQGEAARSSVLNKIISTLRW